MKKRIISAFAAVCVLAGTTAFADGAFSSVNTDRAFDVNRTLYFVEVSGTQIPDITEDGYTLVKKATKVYSGGALTDENTTVLKNDDTGVKYRFVFEKTGGSLDVEKVELSTTGKLTVMGTVKDSKSVKVIILKPTAAFSENAFKAEDIDYTKMEETVLDVVEKSTFSDGILTEYNFPQDASSGQYGVLVVADGVASSYYTSMYYMSDSDIKRVIGEINRESVFDDTHTAETLRKYIEANSKSMYLDMTEYGKLSEKAKTLVASYMESKGDSESEAGGDLKGDYETLADIGEAFCKGVALAWLYDGKDAGTVLDKYNDYAEIPMYDEYKSLGSTAAVLNAVKGITDESALKTAFKQTVALTMLNEAEPGEVEDIVDNYKEELGISDEAYTYFKENTADCIGALANKEFTSIDEIDKKIEGVKDNEEADDSDDNTPTVSKPSSSSKGGSGSSVGYIAPITQTKQPATEEKEPEQIVNSLPFDDIDGVAWAYTAIEHLYNNKILNGKSETSFAPNDNVKREEFVKMVVNAFSFDKTGETDFIDVDPDAWYAEFINIAYANGVVTGISEDEFGVGRYITREDLAVMIYRAVQQTGTELDIIIEEPAELDDLDEVSDYAREAVEFMIEKGAVKGTNGKFNPKAYATRAQTAQMLYQIIKIR